MTEDKFAEWEAEHIDQLVQSSRMEVAHLAYAEGFRQGQAAAGERLRAALRDRASIAHYRSANHPAQFEKCPHEKCVEARTLAQEPSSGAEEAGGG